MIIHTIAGITEAEWRDLTRDESYCILQMNIDGETFDKRFVILNSEDMEEKLIHLAKTFSTTYRIKKEDDLLSQ